ncbi:MAG: very short patch repair endonuclease [Kiritimatiellales bacterium]|nr:very short patch repair endonuclease [Kiritimatiellales bacterium]
MDSLTPEERSKLMGRIRGKNTKPELAVRSILHRAGYRFSLHRKDLPGKPDIVLRKYNTVVFVHGCFWHRHATCKTASTPKSNVEFWQAKFDRNVANDTKHRRALKKLGWKVVTVWECELKKPAKVLARLRKELTAEHTEKVIPYPAQEDAEVFLAAEEQTKYGTKKRKR